MKAALKKEGKSTQLIYALKENDNGICIVGAEDSQFDAFKSKNYRCAREGIQIHFGFTIVDVPIRKKKGKGNNNNGSDADRHDDNNDSGATKQRSVQAMCRTDGDFLKQNPAWCDILERGAKTAWDHIYAEKNQTKYGRKVIEMTMLLAQLFPEYLACGYGANRMYTFRNDENCRYRQFFQKKSVST